MRQSFGIVPFVGAVLLWWAVWIAKDESGDTVDKDWITTWVK